MEGVVRELGGASEVSRMMSTPEPEPVEVDDSIIEEESEEEEEEVRITLEDGSKVKYLVENGNRSILYFFH